WFGGTGQAPDVPMDTDVISDTEFRQYVAALEHTGFFGPNSWYMNHDHNLAFAAGAVNHGKLDMPVLFVHAEFDSTCETVESRLAVPMRQDCSELTEVVVFYGQYMA